VLDCVSDLHAHHPQVLNAGVHRAFAHLSHAAYETLNAEEIAFRMALRHGNNECSFPTTDIDLKGGIP